MATCVVCGDRTRLPVRVPHVGYFCPACIKQWDEKTPASRYEAIHTLTRLKKRAS